jgi:hypothetical protein
MYDQQTIHQPSIGNAAAPFVQPPEPAVPAAASPAPADSSPCQQAAAPTAGKKGGAPRGNENNLRHGLRGSRFPKGAKSDESHVHRLVLAVRAAYAAKHGRELDLYAETVLMRIRRAETSARLAARWLRKEGDGLPLAERTTLLNLQTAAGDTIERCMKLLKLDIDAAPDDPWAVLNDPAPRPLEKPLRFSAPESTGNHVRGFRDAVASA